jgi:hypothetical protein
VRFLIALLGLALTGCIASEAFPTVVDNQSKHRIVVQYHESGFEDWSGLWDIPPGEAQSLAREHWVQDILAIRVLDGNRLFTIGETQLRTIRANCGNSFLTRRLKLAPDCYIIYLGDGRFSATTKAPTGMSERLNKSLQTKLQSSSSS